MTRVVLLHGFAGTADAFDEVRAALGPGFAFATPALLGHGAEAPAVTRYEDEVDRLAAAVATDEPALLLGYSFGGRLAMGLVARHPARWRGAVFVGANPGLAGDGEREARRRADARWTRLLGEGDLERFVDAWEAQPIFASQRRLDPARRARQRVWRARLDPRGLARAMELLGLGAMPCWTDALAAARIPMAFVAGALDEKHVAIGEVLACRVPAMRTIVVPDVGHNVVLEAPGAVAAAVAALA